MGKSDGHRQLTARGIKMMLARDGVDYSALAIRDDGTVWRDIETGELSTSVHITGPKDARTRVFHALLDRGLIVAPYPDHDEWSRSR